MARDPNVHHRDDGGQAPGRPADKLVFLLSKVGAWASQRYLQRLTPLGLDARQVALLRLVAVHEGASQQELAERLGVPASRMVALVDDLEARDLVARRRNPSDRRAYALTLTDAGCDLGRRLAQLSVEHEAEVTAALSSDEYDQLVVLLRRLAAQQDVPLDVHPGFVAPEGWLWPQTEADRRDADRR